MENLQDKIANALEKYAIEEHNDNRSATARALGLANSVTLNHWINKTRAPGIDALQPVFDRLGWQIVFPGQSVRDYANLLHVHDLDAHRHLEEIRKGENVPLDVLEYVGKKMHRQPELLFSLDLLEGLGLDAHDALIFTVESDTMAPVISSGDQILVNKKNRMIEDGRIYLIHTGSYFLVRRVSRELNGDLILQANSGIPNMTVTPELRDQVKILGEVVWVGKKL